jgi:glyoxylate reductase
MTKPRVFMTTKHPGGAYDKLASMTDASCSGTDHPITAEQLAEAIRDADGVVSIIADRFNDEVFRANPRLKVVANVAVGYDNIDVAAATEHAVLVVNTPGVLDDTTADLAFALLLAAARRIVEADRYVRAGKWSRFTFDLLLGTDLGGKTLGIIGMGRIGRAMARRAVAFGMKVIYAQRNRLDSAVEQLYGARQVPMDELLRNSDFISVHCPLTKDTRHLLGKKQFALMKPSCILVNTARGAIIDEAAMVAALRAGRIRAAGLDVFENEPIVSPELLEMDNVVLAPHIGSASTETRSAMADLAITGLLQAFNGLLPPNAVNPEVWPKAKVALGATSGALQSPLRD